MSGQGDGRDLAAVRARLEAYRAARADIAAAVCEAHALGLGPVEIAALSGLTRQGVRKILDREAASRPMPDADEGRRICDGCIADRCADGTCGKDE